MQHRLKNHGKLTQTITVNGLNSRRNRMIPSDKQRYTMVYVGVVRPKYDKVKDHIRKLLVGFEMTNDVKDAASSSMALWVINKLLLPETRTYTGTWDQVKAQYASWREKGIMKQTEKEGRIFFGIFKGNINFKEPKPLTIEDRRKIEEERALKGQKIAEERREQVVRDFTEKHGPLKPKTKEEIDRIVNRVKKENKEGRPLNG